MKILKIFIIFILSFNFVFAKTEINLSVNKNKIDINEQLKLDVDVVVDPSDDNNLVIEGLNDFDVLHQSQSRKMTFVNGVQSGGLTFSFVLQAKEKGKYIIKVGNIKKEVEVTGDKVIVGVQDDLMDYSEKDFEDDKENNDIKVEEDINQKAIDSKTIENKEPEQNKKVLGVDGEEMSDIYDIKSQEFIWPISFFYSFLYLLTLMIVGFILLKYKQYVSTKKSKPVIKKAKAIDYSKLLLSIEKEYIKEGKELFYSQLGRFVRLYLDDKVSMGLSAKTLYEIKGKVREDLYTLIEKIYFPEYDNKEDDIDKRSEIIKEIKYKFINKT